MTETVRAATVNAILEKFSAEKRVARATRCSDIQEEEVSHVEKYCFKQIYAI